MPPLLAVWLPRPLGPMDQPKSSGVVLRVLDLQPPDHQEFVVHPAGDCAASGWCSLPTCLSDLSNRRFCLTSLPCLRTTVLKLRRVHFRRPTTSHTTRRRPSRALAGQTAHGHLSDRNRGKHTAQPSRSILPTRMVHTDVPGTTRAHAHWRQIDRHVAAA